MVLSNDRSGEDTPSPPRLHIRTLGAFLLEADGTSLPADSRQHRKPLALLKVLIALGGLGVPEHRLSASLWPDAEGDRAHRAFATTLHRLRRLLGHEMLVLRDGRLSLDPSHCRVDVWELADTVSSGDSETVQERLLDLYRGPFLAGEEDESGEILAARERLQARFLETLEEHGEALERAGRIEEAAALYRRALVADDRRETIYRRLMRCLLWQDRLAEGIALYERCRHALHVYAGLEPAPETAAIHQALLAARDNRIVLPEQPSLAVLPFDYLGPDPADAALGDGFTETLTTRLARLPGFTVAARNSAFAFRGLPVRLRQVGRALGVRYVLEGGVQKAGGRLRVTVQLIEAESERHLWAEAYDRALTDLFAVQDEIVDGILLGLEVQLSEGEQARRIWRASTGSPAAWELALQALARFRRFTRDDNLAARALCEQALALDPHYAAIMVPLGWTYFGEAARVYSDTPAESLAEAARWCKRALEANPRLGPAHVLRGYLHLVHGEHDQALTELERAAALNPDGADTAALVGYGLGFLGRPTEGLAWLKKAMRLSPSYPDWYLMMVGQLYHQLGRFEEAVNVVRMCPTARGNLGGTLTLAASLAALGRVDEARAVAAEVAAIKPGFTLARHLLRLYYYFRDPAALKRLAGHLREAGLR
jgi:TolB-like protein/Flp pilus assembly protein TadD